MSYAFEPRFHPKSLPCLYCQKVFDKTSNLKRHVTESSRKQLTYCPGINEVLPISHWQIYVQWLNSPTAAVPQELFTYVTIAS